MTRSTCAALALSLMATVARPPDAASQTPATDSVTAPSALKSRIEETWRVVPLRDGVLLIPRRPSLRLKGVELGGAGVAVDGRLVTGPELMERLGADAEPVLQLSYLGADERAALFAPVEPALVERPRAPNPLREPRPLADPLPPSDLRYGRSGARVRLFGPVTVPDGEHVGDVVAVFGSIDLQGTAHGNVVSVFGDVDMGPRASASGDVVAIAGRLRRAPGALASGKLTEIRVAWPDVAITVPGDDQFSLQVTPDWARIARVQWLSASVGAVILLAVCVLTALMAPGAVTAAARPGRSMFVSGLVGLAVQVLLLPAIVLIASALTLSVIGIPLLAGIPVLLCLVAVAAVIGFTGVAARLGSVWNPGGQLSASIVGVVLGLATIWAIGLTGRYMWAISRGDSGWGVALALVGFAIEYACWTIGLGSAVMAWMGRRSKKLATAPVVTPPPVPVDL